MDLTVLFLIVYMLRYWILAVVSLLIIACALYIWSYKRGGS